MHLDEAMKYLEDHNVLRPFVLVKVSTQIKVHEQHADSYKDVEDGSIDLNSSSEEDVEEFFNRFLPANRAAGGGRRKHDARIADWVKSKDGTPVFSFSEDLAGHLILVCRIGKKPEIQPCSHDFQREAGKSRCGRHSACR